MKLKILFAILFLVVFIFPAFSFVVFAIEYSLNSPETNITETNVNNYSLIPKEGTVPLPYTLENTPKLEQNTFTPQSQNSRYLQQKITQIDISCSKFQYPWCKDKVDGLGGSSGLISQFYNYALAAVGVAALGAIIYGGVSYTMSAGNPSGQTEAISWITGAVWGLVLLLGANLLLRTINPEIVSLELPELKKVKIEVEKNNNFQTQGNIIGLPVSMGNNSLIGKVDSLEECSSRAIKSAASIREVYYVAGVNYNAGTKECISILRDKKELGGYYDKNRDLILKDATTLNWTADERRNLYTHAEGLNKLNKAGIDVISSSGLLTENHMGKNNTSLNGIPKKTIDTLIKFKEDPLNNYSKDIVLTGGTENGHSNQGFGKGSVDLKYSDGFYLYLLSQQQKSGGNIEVVKEKQFNINKKDGTKTCDEGWKCYDHVTGEHISLYVK